MTTQLRDRLLSQRVENWLGEMRRNPAFSIGRKPLLDNVTDITFDGIDAKTAEAMVLAAAAGNAAGLLEIFERQMRAVVESLAESHDVDVVDEYRLEQAEIERDRRIDYLMQIDREDA